MKAKTLGKALNPEKSFNQNRPTYHYDWKKQACFQRSGILCQHWFDALIHRQL
jgi:hypothetical protein